jgi:hypothetical protein
MRFSIALEIKFYYPPKPPQHYQILSKVGYTTLNKYI